MAVRSSAIPEVYDDDVAFAAFIPRRVVKLTAKVAVEIGLPLRTSFLALQLPGPHAHVQRKQDGEDNHHHKHNLRETHPRSVAGPLVADATAKLGRRYFGYPRASHLGR